MKCINHPCADELKLDKVLYALGDPIRLKIIQSLSGSDDMACCNAACGLDLAKSTQSYHFRILREAGVISTRRSGIYYLNCLRRDDLNRRFPGLLDAVLNAGRSNHGPD